MGPRPDLHPDPVHGVGLGRAVVVPESAIQWSPRAQHTTQKGSQVNQRPHGVQPYPSRHKSQRRQAQVSARGDGAAGATAWRRAAARQGRRRRLPSSTATGTTRSTEIPTNLLVHLHAAENSEPQISDRAAEKRRADALVALPARRMAVPGGELQELRQGSAVRGGDDGPLRAARHQPQARPRGPAGAARRGRQGRRGARQLRPQRGPRRLRPRLEAADRHRARRARDPSRAARGHGGMPRLLISPACISLDS